MQLYSNFSSTARCLLMSLPNQTNCLSMMVTTRSIGYINKQRRLKGLGPRGGGDPVFYETPEFSFVDGRGFAPLTQGQRRRYLRNIYHCEQIIKYMKQFQIAKQLRPDPASLPEYKMEDHPHRLEKTPIRPRTPIV